MQDLHHIQIIGGFPSGIAHRGLSQHPIGKIVLLAYQVSWTAISEVWSKRNLTGTVRSSKDIGWARQNSTLSDLHHLCKELHVCVTQEQKYKRDIPLQRVAEFGLWEERGSP